MVHDSLVYIRSRKRPSVSEENVFTWLVVGLVILGLIGWATIDHLAVSKPTKGMLPSAASVTLPDFRLQNASGEFVTRNQFVGKFLVVNFIFTGCSSSCLAVSRTMAQIQSRVSDLGDVHLVSITVDPRSDTPSALTKFARKLEAKEGRWSFLTGEKGQLEPLLRTGLMPSLPSLPSSDPAALASLGRILLIDRSMIPRGSFDGFLRNTPDMVVDAVRALRVKDPHP